MRLHSRTGNGVLVGFLVAVVVAAALSPVWAATGKSRDLVVLDHERWLDTLKGTVKNYGKRPAREVTVVVKFFDRKKKALGTQRVNVGDLRSGDSVVLEPAHRREEPLGHAVHVRDARHLVVRQR